MNNIDKQYQALLQDILDNGVEKQDRTGTGTISVFGRQIRYKFKDGKFPLLTTKKMAWKVMVTELLWFLRGDTNIKFLLDYDCHIWDGDCFANYVRNFTKYIDSLPENSETEFIINKDKFINKIKTDDEFAKKWGKLGPIYGKQWRSWGRKNVVNYDLENVKSSDKVKVMDLIGDGGDYSKYDVKVTYQNNSIDQIQNLINELKTNPDSRRLMVNAWNVGELHQMVLPPCHYGFQVYTSELSNERRYNIWFNNNYETGMERFFDPNNIPDFDDSYYTPTPKRSISLMWNQRSVDTPLGLPFNIASYGLLLEIIAKEVNMIPDELIGNLGDCHIYKNQIDGVKEQLTREPYDLPTITITERNWYQHEKVKDNLGPKTFSEKILSYRPDCFELNDYQSHPKIKMPLSN
jgi:thymidylate synthase